MPRNVELKARIASVDAMVPIAAAIATEGPTLIEQDDTFFRCETGRLKLRAFSKDDGELIYYRRADTAGPKLSAFLRSAVSNPDVIRESLTRAYGQTGRVHKHRTLYLAGRTRIHLDRVTGLGDFLELELVLADDEPVTAAERDARALIDRLGIHASALVSGAYVDLLAAAARRAGSCAT